jgi:hypothetical protein
MYLRDKAALRIPAGRLHLLVRISQLGTVAWALGFTVGAFGTSDIAQHSPLRTIVISLVVVSGLAFLAGVIAWTLLVWGIVKCPCCGENFTGSVLWTGDTCRNCGLNVHTVSRPNDF